MRLLPLALIGCVLGCKPKPASPEPIPIPVVVPGHQEILVPAHPQVLQRNEAPDVKRAEGHGGIALDGAGDKGALPVPNRNEAMTLPTDAAERTRRARDLYLQGYALTESQPVEAAALFEKVMQLAPEGSDLRAKATLQLEKLKH